MLDKKRICNVKGAAQCEPNCWVMCCGHVYTDAEISAMLKAGLVTVADKLDRFGRFTLAPGPALDAALLAGRPFCWDDDKIEDDGEITDDDIPF
jgi:hypothetical protein